MQYRLGEGPYGSAYRGALDDILASGDLSPAIVGDRTFGLFLGQFDWVQRLRHVWEVPKPGYRAFLNDERSQHSQEEHIDQVHDFRFTGDQHHLLVGGTGVGKFRDALSNMLLYDGSCETSCLIIDPKGEIASTLGPIIDPKDADDPTTLILDPWNVCKTGFTHALTLLEGLDADSPHCVKDARVLADAIIVHREGDGGHWDQTAKNFLTALLLYLATDPGEVGRRHLRRLRELVTLPWGTADDPADRATLARLLEYLAGNSMFGGIVGRSVQAFLNREPKERSYILSTIERDTEFVEDPSLWEAIDHTTINLDSLVRSGKRLHVVVPFDYIKPMRSWLRLTIAAYYNACLRNQMNATLPKYLQYRHIIIDEFPSLGQLDFMVRDIAEARGAGIKYHLSAQSFSQLKGLYGDQWETFVSNCFIQAFGIDDVFTSEYLSKLTGQATVVTTTEGVSESTTHSRSTTITTGGSKTGLLPVIGRYSSSHSKGETESFATTTGSSRTFSTIGRPILLPDEIRRISEHQQLLFLRGMPVMLARRTPYFNVFKDFMPSYALADVLRKQKQRLLAARAGTATAGKGLVSIAAPSEARFEGASARSAVNAQLREGQFRAPVYRPQTREEALAESRGSIAAAIAAAGAVLTVAVYLAHADLARRRELFDHHQAVITASLSMIEQAATSVAQSVVIPDALLQRLSEEAVRDKAAIDTAGGPAAEILSGAFNAMRDRAMTQVPQLVTEAARPDFDATANRILMDAANQAVSDSHIHELETTASRIENGLRRAAQDAARPIILAARPAIEIAVRSAVANAKDRALATRRVALRSIQADQIDEAARPMIESARKELEEAKTAAIERAARDALAGGRPKILAAGRDAAVVDARKVGDAPLRAMIDAARKAIQETAKRPIATAMDRAASPAFIARRTEVSRGDPHRYVMMQGPTGLTIGFVKTDIFASPGILFEFSPRRAPNYGARVLLDSGRGPVGRAQGDDGKGVFLFPIENYVNLDLRNETTLSIADLPPMRLPEKIRRQLWDWRFSNDQARGRQLWEGGSSQTSQSAPTRHAAPARGAIPKGFQCGLGPNGFGCQTR